MSTMSPNTVICAVVSSGSCGIRETSTISPEKMLTSMQGSHARLISAGSPSRSISGRMGMASQGMSPETSRSFTPRTMGMRKRKMPMAT